MGRRRTRRTCFRKFSNATKRASLQLGREDMFWEQTSRGRADLSFSCPCGSALNKDACWQWPQNLFYEFFPTKPFWLQLSLEAGETGYLQQKYYCDCGSLRHSKNSAFAEANYEHLGLDSDISLFLSIQYMYLLHDSCPPN